MRIIYFVVLGLLITGCSLAQSTNASITPTKPASTLPDGTPKGNAKITGYAVDSTVTKAVEYANVALYDANTNQLIDYSGTGFTSR